MARIRSVHPDICTDDILPGVSARAERTFVRLWTYLDDEGRGVDNPKLIKAALYPLHDDMTPAEVDADLWELTEHGLLLRYEAEGKRLLSAKPEVWKQRQKPKHPTPSKLPGVPDGYTPPERPGKSSPETGNPYPEPGHPAQDGSNGTEGTSRSSSTPHLPPPSPDVGEGYPQSLHGVVDGVGVGEEREYARRNPRPPLALVPAHGSAPAVRAQATLLSYSPDFEAWWHLYPRKVSKHDAQKAFKAALGHATQSQLTDGLRRSVAAWQREHRPSNKLPYAGSWLRGRCWEDDHTATDSTPEPKSYDAIRRVIERRQGTA